MKESKSVILFWKLQSLIPWNKELRETRKQPKTYLEHQAPIAIKGIIYCRQMALSTALPQRCITHRYLLPAFGNQHVADGTA